MDTATHFVMGVAIGGLATLDPVVAGHSVTATSVLIGTIVGSQIPDVDALLKLRNNAVYIRNHRGITHSIPAVFLWPIFITVILSFIFPTADIFHLWLWTSLAVFLHVFVDIFNAYGTQALRPFSAKWIALGVINTFDSIIFFLHILGIVAWILGAHPGYTFLIVYILVILYYLMRFYMQQIVRKKVLRKIPDAKEIIISPTMYFNRWRLAIISDKYFYVGRAQKFTITILDTYKRIPVPETPMIKAAKKDPNIAAFLSFSPVYRWEIKEHRDYNEVRFIDLRYRSNGRYPFVAVAHLDDDFNIITSYTGWIFSEEKLQKKLKVLPN